MYDPNDIQERLLKAFPEIDVAKICAVEDDDTVLDQFGSLLTDIGAWCERSAKA